MKYRVSRTNDSPKKRELKGCSTWSYVIVDDISIANEIKREWQKEGYYVRIEEVKDNETKI